jgi:hypothetical protein
MRACCHWRVAVVDMSVACVILGRCQSRWLRPRPFARQKPTPPRPTSPPPLRDPPLLLSPPHVTATCAASRRTAAPKASAWRRSRVRNPLGHGLPHRRSRVIHLLLFSPRRESLSRHDMLPRPVQPAIRRTAPSFSVPARGFDQFGGGYPGAGAPLRSHRPRRAAAASNPAYADMATSRRTRRKPPLITGQELYVLGGSISSSTRIDHRSQMKLGSRNVTAMATGQPHALG